MFTVSSDHRVLSSLRCSRIRLTELFEYEWGFTLRFVSNTCPIPCKKWVKRWNRYGRQWMMAHQMRCYFLTTPIFDLFMQCKAVSSRETPVRSEYKGVYEWLCGFYCYRFWNAVPFQMYCLLTAELARRSTVVDHLAPDKTEMFHHPVILSMCVCVWVVQLLLVSPRVFDRCNYLKRGTKHHLTRNKRSTNCAKSPYV